MSLLLDTPSDFGRASFGAFRLPQPIPSVAEATKQEETESHDGNGTWHNHLMDISDTFKDLTTIKRKGWASTQGDEYYERNRQTADHADEKTKSLFFNLMKSVGIEMDRDTGVLSMVSPGFTQPRILDLGLAPGGFTAAALYQNPRATIRGISLHPSEGGVEIMVPNWQINPRIDFSLVDITMLAAEVGFSAGDIPVDHPDSGNFIFDRPFLNEEFDLVICGGGVLRTHIRHEYREPREATRISSIQLVLALQRVTKGGSLVVLLHKPDALRTAMLIRLLSKFSKVQLFKPSRSHNTKSSFYLIAKDVQPQTVKALSAVCEWKKDWEVATLGSDEEYAERIAISREVEEEMVSEYGEELIRLAMPVWKTQLQALQRASFNRSS